MTTGRIWQFCAALAVLGVAGCGSDRAADEPSIYGALKDAAAPAIARATGGAEAPAPAAPLSAEQMAARALAANPAPLILAGLESSGATQVMAMTGENAGMRSYMSPNMQALILRGGILTGTKGLGHDLSVVEGDSPSLIGARRAGQATRIHRYISGDGVERPLPMICNVTVGGAKSFAFAGRSWTATQVGESCRSGALTVENSYLVTADGQIPVSRQWIGQQLGYVTLQTIRP